MTRCANCGTRVTAEFRYLEHVLCCECMGGLCSWFLDGGQQDSPDQYEHLGAGADRRRADQ